MTDQSERTVRIVDRDLNATDHNFTIPPEIAANLAPHTVAAIEAEAWRGHLIVCNCAHIPPTMPTARDWHLATCPCAPRDLRWARQVLADPVKASIEASGMSEDDLAELRAEFGEQSRADRLREQRDRISVELNAVEDGTLLWIEGEGSVTAGRFAQAFGFSVTNANNRLTTLRRAGLLTRRRVGRSYVYGRSRAA